jgi:uncharacterized protein YndB with AHSA1/START domain
MADEKHSVRLHRVIKCPAERLFRALTDPKAMVEWMPPHGFVGEVHSMDFKVGGGYRMSFMNFSNKKSHSFGGKYVEIKPNELIRYTDKFDDPNMPGGMSMTVRLRPASCGTELSIVQENIPPMIPTEMCYLGWQESLAMLARLVEAEIP